MPHFRTLLCLAVLAVPATLAAQDTTPAPPKIKHNPDLISTQEIEAAPEIMRTAFELVKQLRPLWLRVRGHSSMALGTPTAQVYEDGIHLGGPSALTGVPRGSIREIQHLRGNDATLRFGVDHENGAILVIRK